MEDLLADRDGAEHQDNAHTEFVSAPGAGSKTRKRLADARPQQIESMNVVSPPAPIV